MAGSRPRIEEATTVCPPEADYSPTISHHSAKAANATMNLEGTVEELEKRLDPMLRGSDPCAELASPSEAFSPHASVLENLTTHITSIDYQIRRLIDRIDL